MVNRLWLGVVEVNVGELGEKYNVQSSKELISMLFSLNYFCSL